MAYRTYQPDRRRRRRRLLLVLLTLVLVIAAIAFLVSRQTERRGTVEFFAAADDASLIHEKAAMLLTETLGQIGPEMPRQELTRRLDEIVSTAGEANALLDLEVPPSVGSLYGTFSAASGSWVAGVEDLRDAILGIVDGTLTVASEVEIQGAFDLLRVGDTADGLFRAGLAELPDDVESPDVPAVTYIDPTVEDPAIYDAQNLALRLAAAYNLSPQHDVGVVGMVEPAAVGDRGGVPVVPFSDTIAVNAIVTNVGNELVSQADVTLEVLDVDAGTSFTLDRTTGEIAAGASTTVTFDDLAIEPDGLYQVVLSVTIPQDANTDNDTWTMTFIWNSET